MTLQECAKAGITRVTFAPAGKPVWNPYSLGDIYVTKDGLLGPWMKAYDPCGKSACGRPMWEPIDVLTVPSRAQMSVEITDQFERYEAPADMDRFPGCPPVPEVAAE